MASNVEILLKATDKASKALANVEKELNKLDGAGKDAAKGTSELGEKLDTLKIGALAAVGVIAGVSVAVKKIYDIGRAGAELEATEIRFNRLADSIGTTGKALREDLGDATGGLFSQAELMQSATDFMSLGLVKTHDEAVRLSSVAGQLGMNMNQLVLTLTNQTTMRFDALGVSTDGFKEKVEALKAAGMEAKEAFNQAFLLQAEEQLERVGSIVDTDIGKIMRLEASVKNLGDAFKRKLAPSVASVAEGITNQINLSEALDNAVKKGAITATDAMQIAMGVTHGYETQAEALERVTQKTEAYQGWLEGFGVIQSDYVRGLVETTDSIEELTAAYDPFIASTEQAAAAAKEISKQVAAADKAAAAAAKSFATLAEKLLEMDAADLARLKMAELEAMMVSGAITSGEYRDAVRGIQLEAGFATEESYAMATAVEMLNRMVDSGALAAADYSAAMDAATTTIDDGIVTWHELEGAIVAAGVTTMEEIDRINGIDLGEATGEIGTVVSLLSSLFGFPAEKNVRINVHTNYTTAGSGSVYGYGGAAGADFVVPPGYPNDSFPLWAQSGEHVQITPAPNSGGGGGAMSDELISVISSLPLTIKLAMREALATSER